MTTNDRKELLIIANNIDRILHYISEDDTIFEDTLDVLQPLNDYASKIRTIAQKP